MQAVHHIRHGKKLLQAAKIYEGHTYILTYMHTYIHTLYIYIYNYMCVYIYIYIVCVGVKNMQGREMKLGSRHVPCIYTVEYMGGLIQLISARGLDPILQSPGQDPSPNDDANLAGQRHDATTTKGRCYQIRYHLHDIYIFKLAL